MLGDKNTFFNLVTSKTSAYIKRVHKVYIAGIFSTVLFALLTIVAIFPITEKIETSNATATPATSSLNITSTSNAAKMEMKLKHKGTVFTTSTSNISFSVTTDNLTGYNLAVKSNNAYGKMVNAAYEDAIDTITSPTSPDIFANDSSDIYVNKWGIKPSKYNSTANTNYIPAPTTNYTILDVTSAPNSTANKYTISIGARLDNSKAGGDYTSNLTITALTNPISYEFNFLDSTNDSTVGNLPDTESGNSVSVSSFILPIDTPIRTGYTFKSWCVGTVTHVTGGNSTCDGKIYNQGASYSNFNDESNPNNQVNFYAMWEDNEYTISIENTDATIDGPTVIKVFYDSSDVGVISFGGPNVNNPVRFYTIYGFTTTDNNAANATVSSTESIKYNYIFDGWYTKDSNPVRVISTDRTLVANTPYTDANGNWVSTSDLNLRTHWSTNGTVELPTITKVGYTCGWTTKPSDATAIEYASGYNGLIPTSDMQLYGVCTPNNYTTTIKTSPGVSSVTLNGITCILDSGCMVADLTYDKEYDLVATIDTGHSFSGWDISGGTITGDTLSTKYSIGAEDSTVTATATVNKYDITIKTITNIAKVSLNGVECTSPDGCLVSGLTYGEAYDLVAEPDPGHSFSAWDAGAYGTIVSLTSATTKYIVGAGNSTITPTNGVINTYNIIIKTTIGVKEVSLNGVRCSSTLGCLVPNLTYGHSYDLTAVIDANYTFSNWDATPDYGAFTDTSSITTQYTIGTGESTITPIVIAHKHNITIKPAEGIEEVSLNGIKCTLASGCVVPDLNYNETYDLAAVVKPGYTFSEWDSSSYGTISNSNLTSAQYTVGSGDSTVVATATPNKYTITIKTVEGVDEVSLNGSKCSLTLGCAVPDLTYGQSYDLTIKPSTGYTFAKWTASPYGSFANNTATTTKYTIGTGDSTITPVVNINKYTETIKTTNGIYSVTLNGTPCYNKDSGCTVSDLTYKQSYDLTAEPNAGYSFSSWNAGSYGEVTNTKAATTKYTVGSGNSTITVSAKINSYKLTVDPNGGVWNGSSSSQTITKNYNETYELADPSSGPSFSISYNANGQGATYTGSPTSVKRTFTSWSKSGSGSLSGKTYTFGTSDGKVTANYNNPTATLPEIAKSGYTCKWAKGSASGAQIASKGSVTIDGDTTFYAVCTVNSYNLTVNPNGGTWSGSTGSQNFSQNYGTTKSIPNPTAGPTYSITYNANSQGATYTGSPTTVQRPFSSWTVGGSGSLSGTTYTFGAGNGTLTATYNSTSNTFTLPAIAKTGYTCQWAEGSTSGTKYNGGASRTITGNKTYYAVCTINNYNLTVKPNGGTWSGKTTDQVINKPFGTKLDIAKPTAGPTYSITYNANSQGATYTGSPTTVQRPFSSWTVGGSGSLSGTTYTFGAGNGTLTATYNSTSNTFTLPAIAKTGYTCQWAEGSTSGTKYNGGASRTITGNKTYYAVCTILTPTLTVNPNGGTWGGKTTSQSFTQNYNTTKTIANPTAGPTYSITYNANSQEATYSPSPASVQRPFSSWSKGGGGTLSGTTYTFGTTNGTLTATYSSTSNTFKLPAISKTGYDCKWAEGSTSGTQYAGGTSRTITANKTYYAKCTAKSYNITVEAPAIVSQLSFDGYDCSNGCKVSLTYDKAYTIKIATISDVTFSKWTATAGSFADKSSTSTKYTVKGTATITPTITTPYIQDYSLSTCESKASSKSVKTVDYRDGQIYTVRYIKDRCWMTKNLAIGCNGVGNTYGNSRRTNVTLTKNDTNTTLSSYKTSNDNLTSLGTTSSPDSYTASRMYCSDSVGAWYNYKAATIGRIKGSSTTEDGDESLCPKNWKLPTKGQANTLVGNSDIRKAFNATAGGRWYGGGRHESEKGLWWTRTASSGTERNTLFFNYENSERLEIQTQGRERGLYIRCVRAS